MVVFNLFFEEVVGTFQVLFSDPILSFDLHVILLVRNLLLDLLNVLYSTEFNLRRQMLFDGLNTLKYFL